MLDQVEQDEVQQEEFIPWKVLYTRDRRHYTEAKVSDPFAGAKKDGWIPFGRVVMENHLGRYLRPGELVRHIDRNPHNNDISNLEIVTQAQMMNLVRDFARNNGHLEYLKPARKVEENKV